jgi:hypothetical protein
MIYEMRVYTLQPGKIAAFQAQGEDPQLQAFRSKALATIVSQYNKILVPANFSPLK